MKLIAYGKVLEDASKCIKDYGIKEGDFLVVMISKVSSLFIDKFQTNRLSCNRLNHPQSLRLKTRNKKRHLRQDQLKLNLLQLPFPPSYPQELPRLTLQVQESVEFKHLLFQEKLPKPQLMN